MEFAQRNISNDPLVNVVWKIYRVVPPILESLGKIKNPWPNVDAHSGALLVHYGLKNMDSIPFYLVFPEPSAFWLPFVGQEH